MILAFFSAVLRESEEVWSDREKERYNSMEAVDGTLLFHFL